MLDETPDALSPLTGPKAGPLRIGTQRAVMVAGQPATLFYLTVPTAPAGTYVATGLLWHSGALTMRLLTSNGGGYDAYTSDIRITFRTRVLPPGLAGSLEPGSILIQIAESIAPYTGCS